MSQRTSTDDGPVDANPAPAAEPEPAPVAEPVANSPQPADATADDGAPSGPAARALDQGQRMSPFGFVRRFPVQTGLALAASIVALAAGGLQLADRFVGSSSTPERAVAIGLVESELAALSGGTTRVGDVGQRVFGGGVKARLQISLRHGAARAVINAIALRPIEDVPDEVDSFASAPVLASREPFSWAGARPVETYFGEWRAGSLRIAYNDGGGQLTACAPDNVLSCASGSRVIELSESGTATHTVDLMLAYLDDAPTGVVLVVRYAVDGVEHEESSEPIYLYN